MNELFKNCTMFDLIWEREAREGEKFSSTRIYIYYVCISMSGKLMVDYLVIDWIS